MSKKINCTVCRKDLGIITKGAIKKDTRYVCVNCISSLQSKAHLYDNNNSVNADSFFRGFMGK